MENLTEKEKEILIRIGYYYIGSECGEGRDALDYRRELDKAIKEILDLWKD